MNKKLIAIAVAGLFVAPAAALAQSSVTITGKVMGSAGDYKIGGRSGDGRNSEGIIRDESSRIIFLVREDLGGGLAAIGKFDLRPSITDTGAMGNTGESYVGLTSPSWGTLALGRFDFHYGNHASYTGVHAGLLTNPTALFDVAGAGGIAIANQTRTNNAIRYGSPKFGNMFEVVVGYSTNPTAASTTPAVAIAPVPLTTIAAAATFNNQQESDLRSTQRRGYAWHLNPKLFGTNWEAGYSYWMARPDLALTTTINGDTGLGVAPTSVAKHRGDSLYGSYLFGGFRVGLAWNRSTVNTTAIATNASATSSRRTTWGIPLAYNWGSHNIYADFYRAGADRVIAGDTKATFMGLTYAYDMSKRTTAAVSFNRIRNGAQARYNLFAAATPGGSLAQNKQGVDFGEDPRYLAVTLQHRF